MTSGFLVGLAIFSVIVSVVAVLAVIFIVLSNRRQQAVLRAQIVDPVVLEAARVQSQINVLLIQLRELNIVVGEGKKASDAERKALEARIARLQDDLIATVGEKKVPVSPDDVK